MKSSQLTQLFKKNILEKENRPYKSPGDTFNEIPKVDTAFRIDRANFKKVTKSSCKKYQMAPEGLRLEIYSVDLLKILCNL